MSVVVTGATGHLGRLVVENLLARGVAPAEVVATGRRVEALADLAERGVQVRRADFAEPASLLAAFAGADDVLLVSGSEVGRRVAQHASALEAIRAVGARRVVYTSAPRADSTALVLAPEHKATEELIRASGLAFTILRNNWYTENYLGDLAQARATGEIVSSVGAGRVASAPRSDYAAAAAVVLLSGCANRDSITVGSIPDDYRTNHPIVISEKDEKIDIPVGASDRGATRSQRQTLLGFLDGYDRSAAPVLTIAVPSGSLNELAARAAARDFRRIAIAGGVHASRIAVASYQVSSADVSAPIRVAYSSMRAHTDKCGRWPEDVLETSENKHYANFGCANQNNLAAQIANPADLLGPRASSPIDAERRSIVIGDYRPRVI